MKSSLMAEALCWIKKAKKLLTCQQFSEDINVIDLNTLEVWNKNPKLEAIEELRRALVLGIRDFCEKTGIKKSSFGSQRRH
ncbi:hypothetical protein ACES2J_17815 [Bdellovibrio bacteriovorus]|uniref:hypothetical protein n=1 Tax=Bdellovibrio bacteriovorus TaxID=959 RepID=UPI0035A5F1E2